MPERFNLALGDGRDDPVPGMPRPHSLAGRRACRTWIGMSGCYLGELDLLWT